LGGRIGPGDEAVSCVGDRSAGRGNFGGKCEVLHSTSGEFARRRGPFPNHFWISRSCDVCQLLVVFIVSSLSTAAENVDTYDVSISYGRLRIMVPICSPIVAVINSFCPFHFRSCRRACAAEHINRRRRYSPLCPLLMPAAVRACVTSEVDTAGRPMTTYVTS